jgi:hypothetical protein
MRLFGTLQVGYDGTYQPVVAEYASSTERLDWVQGSTSSAKLRLS